jgi:hypothetical protein
LLEEEVVQLLQEDIILVLVVQEDIEIHLVQKHQAVVEVVKQL